MPIGERRERHAALLARVREHDVHRWSRDYLHALALAHRDTRAAA
jgi:trehalose 6-phosphate synthase